MHDEQYQEEAEEEKHEHGVLNELHVGRMETAGVMVTGATAKGIVMVEKLVVGSETLSNKRFVSLLRAAIQKKPLRTPSRPWLYASWRCVGEHVALPLVVPEGDLEDSLEGGPVVAPDGLKTSHVSRTVRVRVTLVVICTKRKRNLSRIFLGTS